MFEVFTYSFMQRAFLVGNIVAIICPIIGVIVTLKRLTLIGETLSHVALAGAALGLILNIYPVYLIIIITVFAALGIDKLSRDYRDYAEISLSVILAAGLGLAIVLINLSNSSGSIFSYLFGSIILISKEDLRLILPLGIVISGIMIWFYYGFLYLSFNEEEAKLAGVPIRALNLIFMVMISLTISFSLRIVGGLLVASLITLPVATALQIAKSFKQTMIYSICFGLLAINTGLFLSFYFDLASGGTIILSSTVFLLLALLYKRIKKKFKFKKLVKNQF